MVSQVTGQYADIYAWDNLYLAYRQAARGKRARATTAAFEYHLEDNLIQLQDELAGETYRPGPYQHFTQREQRSGVSGGVSVPRLPVGAPGSGSGDQHQGFCAGHGLRSEV